MKVKKFTLFMLTFVAFLALQVNASVSDYTFTYSSGTYTEITGTVSTATGDDGAQNLTLPFTFVYDGVSYTTARVSTNGWLEMGTLVTASAYINDLASTTYKPFLCPLWDDLYDDASGDIQYTTTGTTPNRVFIVQWKNINWYYSGGSDQNFQIRLYESTNVVEFIYGTMNAPLSTPSASIGINDATGGSGHFISITPGATPTSSTTVANNAINASTYLTSGLIYTFTPPAIIVPTLTFQPWWAVTAGSFISGGQSVFACPMVAGISYNFSICANDGVGGAYTGTSDGDFTLYSDAALTTQVWYIDGASTCSYNASTIGTAFENYAPTLSQTYYLVVDDWGGGSGSFNLAYQGRFVTPPAFDGTCQNYNVPAFGASGGVFHKFYMTTTGSYNFSTCLNDVCPGAAAANDADFYFFDASGTQIYYIDGPSACGYDATTYGTAYQDYVPPADGYYYLYINDYYGAAGSGIVLAYTGVTGPQPGYWTGAVSTDWNNTGNWADGTIPTSTVSVTIPAGCSNYPDINVTGNCDFLTIDAGAGMIVNYGGTLNVGGNVTNNGTITNYGDFLITGDYNSEATAVMNQLDGNWSMYWFTHSGFWGDGTLVASGGNIYTAEAVLAAYTTMTFNGPFTWYVGQVARWDAANFTASPSGGNVVLTGYNLQTLTTYTDCYLYAPGSPQTMCFYDLTINTPAATNNVYMVGSFGTSNHQVFGDLNILGGHVRTDNTVVNSFFDVFMELFIADNNDADLSVASGTTFTVNGQTYQYLSSNTGYGSVIGSINHIGQFNFIVEIEGLSAGRWELISPPVSDATANTFLCQYLMGHDPATNTWSDIIDPSTALNPGYDYALWVHPDVLTGNNPCSTIPANTIFTWTGSRNSWAPVTATLGNGWNNVGNPYTATIDWTNTGWTKNNVNDAIYFENNGTWSGYVAGVPYNGGSQYIAPTQGFFVESTGGGSLGFATSTASHTRTTFYKSDISNILRLTATGNGRSDETVIRITNEASAGFDPMYDAHKLFNNAVEFPGVPQFYSMDNNYMAVNAIDAAEMVALGFRAGLAGTYTICQNEANDFANVVLEDLATGTFTNLLESTYSFSYNPGENEGRFIVHFTPLAVSDKPAENLHIYSYGGVAYINVPENLKGDITVYNVMGQLVTSVPVNNVLNHVALPAAGTYIVKVTTNEKVFTQKVNIQ